MQRVERWGNERTGNIAQILYSAITQSHYYAQLLTYDTFEKVRDEIYEEVGTLEPWDKRQHPSVAFTLLLRFHGLKLSAKQVYALLDCKDSGYVRAMGLLYLRHVANPKTLYDWFEPYLESAEEQVQINAGQHAQRWTIGRIARELLTAQKWLGLMLPRIPLPVAREIASRLKGGSGYSAGGKDSTPLEKSGKAAAAPYARGGGSERDPPGGRSHEAAVRLDEFGREVLPRRK